MITVMLVDDHPVVRAGLRGMLEVEPDILVVAEAGSGAEALALAAIHHPRLVLMDLRMPGGDGVETTRTLREELPDTTVVMLTTYDGDADILRAVAAGAAGYLLKDATSAELADAVRAASRGETVLARAVAGRLVRQVRDPNPTTSLSARELEVLQHVAAGATNAEVGRSLFISEATVKTHLVRIFTKLEVTDRTAAVTTAMARGLLVPGTR